MHKLYKFRNFSKTLSFHVHHIGNDVISPAKLFYDSLKPEVAQLR